MSDQITCLAWRMTVRELRDLSCAVRKLPRSPTMGWLDIFDAIQILTNKHRGSAWGTTATFPITLEQTNTLSLHLLNLADGRDFTRAIFITEANKDWLLNHNLLLWGSIVEVVLPDIPKASTPSSRWKKMGESDPHGTMYLEIERAKLTKGDLTDDELANAVFLYDHRSGLQSIAYLTAAKERIRWLSRQLEAARTRIKELEPGKVSPNVESAHERP